MSQSFAQLLRQAGAALQEAGIMDAGRDARALVALAAGVAPDRLTLLAQDAAPEGTEQRLQALLTRRAERREPLSHITGQRAFYDHVFEVTPDVLDPRSDTETLVAAALERPFDHVLDLGTGSGCILLSLLAARAGAAGVGTDISSAALEVAHRNAQRLSVAERCLLVRSDWYEQVEGRFDLIVSNPPYIAASEMPGLAPELRHEPRGALSDEADGLSAYRVIIPGAVAHLKPKGRLMVEIGWQQGAAVRDIFDRAGFRSVCILPDLEGRDRVVSGEITP